MPTLDDIASFFATSGLGTVGTNIFKGGLSETPDSQIALVETGGQSPVHLLGASELPEDRAAIQVLVRGNPHDYATPRATAETAYRSCDGINETTIAGTRYLAFGPLQPPFLLESDESGRFVIVFNILVRKERV